MNEQQIINRINSICHFNASANFPVVMRPTAFAIITFLELMGRPMRAKEIYPILLNKHETTIRHCLNELESLGLVRNVAPENGNNRFRQQYVITAEGKQYLRHYDDTYNRTQEAIKTVTEKILAEMRV